MIVQENQNAKLGLIKRFLEDDSGASAIEYSIIAGGIAVAIAGAVTLLGDSVSGNYNNVDNSL